eukprot:gnl/TRDRNA2_/TRDRNA2_86485_c0_seq1.p1 gnl/TRDRNA2_/TRDRNA2_86485_c0~~gnl/TRDRNA2_/TRDRNA2_86485_c0_seq1.p1  ORF type:complete len:209 (+),score=34.61 gnl/TRDRNA2_/TRDRNA2_86485_c0_seq1:105-731(+)
MLYLTAIALLHIAMVCGVRGDDLEVSKQLFERVLETKLQHHPQFDSTTLCKGHRLDETLVKLRRAEGQVTHLAAAMAEKWLLSYDDTLRLLSEIGALVGHIATVQSSANREINQLWLLRVVKRRLALEKRLKEADRSLFEVESIAKSTKISCDRLVAELRDHEDKCLTYELRADIETLRVCALKDAKDIADVLAEIKQIRGEADRGSR